MTHITVFVEELMQQPVKLHLAELTHADLVRELKDLLDTSQQQLFNAFSNKIPIQILVKARADLIDQLLQALWSYPAWPNQATGLFAVGGYGRGQLHPHSDIDLLLLHEGKAPNQALKERIQQFSMILWDIGLKVGQSVRSVEECFQQAKKDVTIASNLLEMRQLAGDRELLKTLQKKLSHRKYWPIHSFFEAKISEQQERHAKHHHTEYNLEPDIKTAPGGLRDIHIIGWIARKHSQSTSMEDLIGQDFLTEAEFNELKRCRSFLWQLRFALHIHTGRDDNRLLFDYQKSIASIMGYEDSTGQQAVERMMKDYYRCALTITTLNELVLQHFSEVILEQPKKRQVCSLNAHFQVCHQLIEVIEEDTFAKHPEALIEIFILLANHADFKGFSAKTIRLIRIESERQINAEFRANPAHQALFLQLLRSPHQLYSTLNKMKRYGVLNRYIPAFEAIIGQMQFDLFHIYTVDAHTLRVIKNLRMFRYSKYLEHFPIAAQLFHQFKKIELLYLAALFHDLAKGRGGDHSTLGAVDAREFCQQHGLEPEDSELVAWLVEHHLLMSTTAQKHDLYDPDVIQTFAEQVGTLNYLNHLYTLTVADINATNPKLWNAWRAELLSRLYLQTKQLLMSGEPALGKTEKIAELQSFALNHLSAAHQDLEVVKTLWTQFDDEYFLKETPESIAWHTQAILHHSDTHEPLIVVRPSYNPGTRQSVQIFVYTQDRSNLFFDTVATLDRLGLTVLDAAITSSTQQFSLDTYLAQMDSNSGLHQEDAPLQLIQESIYQAITEQTPTKIRQLRIPQQLRSFDVKTEIEIHNAADQPYTQVSVKTLDRPGLLAKLAEFFSNQNLDVHAAKILTLGEKAEDVFAITNQAAEPIMDQQDCEQLKNGLITHLKV